MGIEEIVTKRDLMEMEQRILKQLCARSAPQPEKWLNMEQAANYIKARIPRALWNKVKVEEIPYIRDGKSIKFNRQDLDNYIQSHRVASEEEIISVSRTI